VVLQQEDGWKLLVMTLLGTLLPLPHLEGARWGACTMGWGGGTSAWLREGPGGRCCHGLLREDEPDALEPDGPSGLAGLAYGENRARGAPGRMFCRSGAAAQTRTMHISAIAVRKTLRYILSGGETRASGFLSLIDLKEGKKKLVLGHNLSRTLANSLS
jgi:hypothetical protein